MGSNKLLRYFGLTGGIASGKSTIANIFEELGCYTIDADQISRIVMAKGGLAYEEVIKNFPDITDLNGEIDRKKLRDIVFNDPDKRLLLESIVHPKIHLYEKKLVSSIKSKDHKAIIITQAALIIEKNSYHRFDGIILVYADETEQIRRLMDRDHIDEASARKIMSAQMSFEEKLKYANFVVDNSKSLEYTRKDVQRVYNLIQMLNYGLKHQHSK